MRTLLLAVALAALTLVSCGATLRLSARVPTQDNGGTCANPVLGPTAAGPNIYMRWVWYGAEVDSVTTGPYAPGDSAHVVREVKPGLYTRYAAVAIDGGGESCRFTVAVNDVLKSRLATPFIYRKP